MEINENEKKILEILKKDPFVNQKYIAYKLSLSRSAIANLISGLQEKGYILGKPYLLKKENYVTCVGSANLDYSFRLEEGMILGTSNPVQSSISYGGVVRNIADNLSRLNHQVSLMSVVGEDSMGDDLIDTTKHLMNVFATDKISNESTGSYYSVIGKDGEMVVGFANMSINNRMNREWVLSHRRHLNMSSWIIADSNITKDALETLIEFSESEKKKLAIIGVSGPKMKNIPDDLSGVEIIICNLDESQSYFKTNNDDLKELSKLWLNKGVKKAIITAGKNGCVYMDRLNTKYQAAFLIPEDFVIDVTGAGDAFSSAVLHGLIHGETFDKSVKLGVVSSSLTIQTKAVVNPKLSIKLLNKELEKNEII
ncbi:MAG: winged helix-turn-helix transcriptional regulator [Candidatus Izimaplasma sp.]|nr:winged helix-turn-helix transcriptional regulator [Candidatus Izimaplasma bacterium]